MSFNFFGFGRKRRSTRRKVTRRRKVVRKGSKKGVSRSLLSLCKKYHVKCTKKVGKRKVYKSISVLKKLLRRKRKSSRKVRRSHLKVHHRRRRTSIKRRFRFGDAAAFVQPDNYGYNEKVQQSPGVLSQSSQVVTSANNINRPPGFGVDANNLPIYGVYRPFFTENVPTTVGPSWNFMGQPDGSLFPVGGPFAPYTSFGKRRRGRKGGKMYADMHADMEAAAAAFGKRRRGRKVRKSRRRM
jgi:hypothetical protein